MPVVKLDLAKLHLTILSRVNKDCNLDHKRSPPLPHPPKKKKKKKKKKALEVGDSQLYLSCQQIISNMICLLNHTERELVRKGN